MKIKIIPLISVVLIAAFARQDIVFAGGDNLRPAARADREPTLKIDPALTDGFIDSILTDHAREAGISDKQRERIKQIVAYFWTHEGWASAWDLRHAVGDKTQYIGLSDEEIHRDLNLDIIDLGILARKSRKIHKPVPLFFTRPGQKKRLKRTIEIVEALGWRATVNEIAEVAGQTSEGAIPRIFSNCNSYDELRRFIADVNHNRKLGRKLQLEIFISRQPGKIKRAQDRFICALEAFDGRASSADMAAVLGILPHAVTNIHNQIDYKSLNEKRRAQGKIPLIGIIYGSTKGVEDEIISALEDLGGVATIPQIAKHVGMGLGSASRVIANMKLLIINEIRVRKGLFPLYVLGHFRNARLIELDNLARNTVKGEDQKEIVTHMLRYYKGAFGKIALRSFRERVVPFAYRAVYMSPARNGKPRNKRSTIEVEWLNNIFQRTLELIIKDAISRTLHKGPRKRAGIAAQDMTMVDYFEIVVPRALNISREILAEVNVSEFNPLVCVPNGERGVTHASPSFKRLIGIPPEDEVHFALFLRNLDLCYRQMLSNKISFNQGFIISDDIRRITQALKRYEEITRKERQQFEEISRYNTGVDDMASPGLLNAAMSSVLRPQAKVDRGSVKTDPTPTNEFIDSILTGQARETGISDKQRERIRRIIAYFWDHEGWASKWELVGANDSTDTTFLTDLKKIDLEKLKRQSRANKKPIPLYFSYGRQKERISGIVGIVESLGWRASVQEIGECLDISPKNKGTISVVFTNCENSTDLVVFINDVNYNRRLAKKLPLEILFSNKAIKIKESQDRLINALEAFDGRATATDLAKILDIRPDSIWKIWKKIEKGLSALNERRRAQGLIPIIGVIPESTKLAQDKIILALEELGGVATLSQVTARMRQGEKSTRVSANGMDFTLINEIRVVRGLFPLFIIPRSRQKNLRLILGKTPRMQKNSEPMMIAQSISRWQRHRFGLRSAKDFENRTVPFAYAVVYGNNGNGLVKKREVGEKEWLNNIFQRLLEVVVRHAEEKGLYAAPKTQRGSVSENQALIEYYRIAVPRALNISRKELANVDVMRFNTRVLDDRGNGNGGRNGSRRNTNAIKPEEEENMAAFLANLDKALKQLSPEGEKISFSGGSIIPNRLKRVEAAYAKYRVICARETERFQRTKAQAALITSSPARQSTISAASSVLRPLATGEGKSRSRLLAGEGRPVARADRGPDLRTGNDILREVSEKHKYFLDYAYEEIERELSIGEDGILVVEKEFSKLDKDHYPAQEINMLRFIVLRELFLLRERKLPAPAVRELLEKDIPDTDYPVSYRLQYYTLLGTACLEEGGILSATGIDKSVVMESCRAGVSYLIKAGVLMREESNRLRSMNLVDAADEKRRAHFLGLLKDGEEERIEMRNMGDCAIIDLIAGLDAGVEQDYDKYEPEVTARSKAILQNKQYLEPDMLNDFWRDVRRFAAKLRRGPQAAYLRFIDFLDSANAAEQIKFIEETRKNMAELRMIMADMALSAVSDTPEAFQDIRQMAINARNLLIGYWGPFNRYGVEGYETSKSIGRVSAVCAEYIEQLKICLNYIAIHANPLLVAEDLRSEMLACVKSVDDMVGRFEEVINYGLLSSYEKEFSTGPEGQAINYYVISNQSTEAFRKLLPHIQYVALSKIEPGGSQMREIRHFESRAGHASLLGKEAPGIKECRESPHSDRMMCMLSRRAGRITGYILYDLRSDHIEILNIIVFPEYANQGIEAEMMTELKHIADNEGYEFCSVSGINGNNAEAMRFLTGSEFKVGRIIRDQFGEGAHGYVMIYTTPKYAHHESNLIPLPAPKTIPKQQDSQAALESI